MEFLKDVRIKLDKIDSEMIALFIERMEISKEVARIKSKNGLPVFDAEREKQKLLHSVHGIKDTDREDVLEFMQFLMDKSKERQRKTEGK